MNFQFFTSLIPGHHTHEVRSSFAAGVRRWRISTSLESTKSGQSLACVMNRYHKYNDKYIFFFTYNSFYQSNLIQHDVSAVTRTSVFPAFIIPSWGGNLLLGIIS